MPRLAASLFLLTSMLTPGLHAQSPVITKIDPPNWFAALPKPMLLVRGEHLTNATFTLSDPALTLDHTSVSANGHWAQLWLAASPAIPETIRVRATSGNAHAEAPYTFAARSASPSGFSSADVLYLILPDRFADGDPANDRPAGSPAPDRHDPHAYHGGDLQGVIDHLDYLQQLGVTAIWLTPILQNDPKTRDYHGYGATDMYAVEPRLGTLATYRHLADELHRRGMKLVFDDVPNHVGQANPWVTDPPMPDWFHGTAAHHADNKYAFGPITDPHAAPAASLDALDGWFVNILPDMNQQNPAVAQYLTQNMIWWIEQAGIDGLRIDTFPYVQRDFWQQYLSQLTALYPRLTSIAEVTTGDPSVNAFFAGGRTLDGVDTHVSTPFDYPLYYTLLDVLVKARPMSQLEETLRKDWLYPHPEALVPFLSNHDQVRFLSQPGATPALLRIGFGLLLTLRGMPELYAGDEVLMQGGEDPDNRHDFPGGFSNDPANAFTAAGRTSAQATMHDWLAALGTLRAASPALQTGRMQTVFSSDTAFAYLRTVSASAEACQAPGAKLIVLNRSPSPQTLKLPTLETALRGCLKATLRLGDGTPVTLQPSVDSLSIPVPANGFAIYDLE